jgi:hypothetical protein
VDEAPPPDSLDQEPELGSPGAARWWRAPLAAAVVAIPLVTGAVGVRIGCDSGTLDLAVCGNVEAPVAAAEAEVEVAGGRTTLTVTDEAGAPVAVAQEPAGRFASQFTKFVIVAPDNSRALYVTAADLGMTDAQMWVVPRGGQKTMLKAFADEFWVARPVWCQRRPGDPGRIAYVLKGPADADRTGLELTGAATAGCWSARARTASAPTSSTATARRRCASWPAASTCASSTTIATIGTSSIWRPARCASR